MEAVLNTPIARMNTAYQSRVLKVYYQKDLFVINHDFSHADEATHSARHIRVGFKSRRSETHGRVTVRIQLQTDGKSAATRIDALFQFVLTREHSLSKL